MAARRGPATRGKSEPQGQLAATTTSFGCSAGLSFMDVTKPQLFGVMSFISEMNAQPWLSAGFASHRREELELRQVRHASLGQVEIQESDLLLSLSRSVIRIGVIRFEVGFVRIFFVDLGARRRSNLEDLHLARVGLVLPHRLRDRRDGREEECYGADDRFHVGRPARKLVERRQARARAHGAREEWMQ